MILGWSDPDYGLLVSAPGVFQNPRIPRFWRKEVRPYAAILRPGEGKLDRSFISDIVWSKSGKTGKFYLDISLQDVPFGWLLEVRCPQRFGRKRGEKKKVCQYIYRKDEDGWKMVAYRYPFERDLNLLKWRVMAS